MPSETGGGIRRMVMPGSAKICAASAMGVQPSSITGVGPNAVNLSPLILMLKLLVSFRRNRLCRNSKKRLHSACHAGLDPASSSVIPRKSTGFRVKSGMTKAAICEVCQLRHSLESRNPVFSSSPVPEISTGDGVGQRDFP
jgi:hypothetical protein